LSNWIPTHRDLMHSITLEIFTEIWLPHNGLLASKSGKKASTIIGAIQYLRGYGFFDKLDVSKTELVDEILRSEGAFISRRRVGYLIVAPERNLVIFAHAG
ncbi:hypothetical protein, partial [Pseudophaeobacter sp.]|uniref:hypothetical protein n=1 Tax=Pseudophaeobacter sp. TaxID=1971739 RepID=UPI0032982D1B